MVKIRYSDEFICPKCGSHTALVCHVNGTYQAHCMICDAYFDVEVVPITNADRIRAMSDEELAAFICKTQFAFIPRSLGNIPISVYDGMSVLKWLKQEAET